MCFTGKADDYETWEEKVFFAFLSEQGYEEILNEEGGTSAESSLKKKRVYNIVIQLLDRESIRLVKHYGKSEQGYEEILNEEGGTSAESSLKK